MPDRERYCTTDFGKPALVEDSKKGLIQSQVVYLDPNVVFKASDLLAMGIVN